MKTVTALGLLPLVIAAHAWPASSASRTSVVAVRATATQVQDDKPTSRQPTAADRKLLDALGTCPGTTLILEYVPEDGGLGRHYACPQSPERQCGSSAFYDKRIRDLGWQNIEQHAAVSAYGKGHRLFAIFRSGPIDLGLPPRARALKRMPTPADAKFFFSIEVGPKPRE